MSPEERAAAGSAEVVPLRLAADEPPEAPATTEPDEPPDALELTERALRAAIGVAALVAGSVAHGLAATFGPSAAQPEGSTGGEAPPRDLLPMLVGAGLAVALDAGRTGVRTAAAVGRSVGAWASFATGLGVVRDGLERGSRTVERLDERWRAEQRADEQVASSFLHAIVPQVVDATLDQLDLTELVLSRVDLDRIVASVDIQGVVDRLDLDAIASNIDVEAIVRRLDLAAIAREVIDEIDLPQIVRESTGTLADETVEGIRAQSMVADRTVERAVDRILRRTGGRREPGGHG